MISKVSEGVAEGGKLPVKDRDDARLGGVEDQIVASEVAMNDARLIAKGYLLRQPFDESIHASIPAGIGVFEILLGPARDLALKIVAWSAIVTQAHAIGIEAMERRDRFVHRVKVANTIFTLDVRECRVPEYSAIYHFHDEESTADHAVVHAEPVDVGYGRANSAECSQNMGLALDCMGAFKERSGRLPA